MSTLAEYVECQECGFVLLSASSEEPEPQRVDSCPDCSGTDFGFTSS